MAETIQRKRGCAVLVTIRCPQNPFGGGNDLPQYKPGFYIKSRYTSSIKHTGI